MPVIMDQRDSWFTGAVGAVLVAGAVFFGVVMSSVYERMLGVCFEGFANNFAGLVSDCGRFVKLIKIGSRQHR
jgi:hypothetical protein